MKTNTFTTRIAAALMIVMIALAALPITPAYAAACSWDGSSSTAWGTGANWTGCTGPAGVPAAADTITIPSAPANQPVLGAAATVAGLTVNSGASLTLGTQQLTVNGPVSNAGTITASTGRLMQQGVGDFTNSGTVTFTGAGRIYFSGNVTNTGTLTLLSAEVRFYGADAGPFTVAGFTTTGVVDWRRTAGTVTFAGSVSASQLLLNNGGGEAGTLILGAGNTFTFPTVATITGVALTNNGTLTVSTLLSGTGLLTNSSTGTLNLTGGTSSISTLANAGTVSITGAATSTTTLANFTNTSTINLNTTGAITGITNNAGGTVNLTNSGTIASFNNATATSTLNISDLTPPTITTLTVTTAGNTVNYNGAGNQTVRATAYNKLILSGSGVKSLLTGTSTTGTGNNLSIAPTGSATASVGAGLNLTIGSLTVGTLGTDVGTWGSTSSTATYQNNTYFAATTGRLTVGTDTRGSQATLAVSGPASLTYGATGTITTSGGSGSGAISYAATVSTGCTVNPSTGVITVTDASNACTVTATKAADGNYLQATSAGFAVTLNKAVSTTVVTGGTFPYDGSAHAATVSVTGAGGLSLTPSPDSYTGSCATAPTTVAEGTTCTAGYTYAGDANHTGSSDTDAIVITKATSTTTVTGVSVIYDGSPHAATVSVTGAGALSLTPSPDSYTGSCATAPTTVAEGTTCTAGYTYAGDANHFGSNDTDPIVITMAASTTVVTGGSFPYDGSPHDATVSVTGAGGLSLTPSPDSYTGSCAAAPTTVAEGTTCTAGYTYAGDANHTGSSDTDPIAITMAASTTVVTGGSSPYDGAAHAATVSVTGAGGLSLTPSPSYSGTCTTAPTTVAEGTSCTADYIFAGDDNHTGSSDTDPIVITKATTTTVVTGGTFTYDGFPHDATVSVTGAGGLSLTADPDYTGSCSAAPTTVPEGTSCSAAYTYAGDDNYNGSSDSDAVVITQAASTTVVTGGSFTYDGSAHTATVSVTGAGGLNLTPTADYTGSCSAAPITVAEGTTCTAGYTFAGDDNHTGSNDSDAVIVTTKAVSVTASDLSKTVGAGDPTLSTTHIGFIAGDLGAGKITFSATRVSGEDIGTYDITPAADDAGTGLLDNYDVTLTNGTFTISDKLVPTVSVDCGTNTVTYGSNISCTVTVERPSGTNTPTGDVAWTGGVGGFGGTTPCTLSSAVSGIATCSATYTPTAVDTGTHTVIATYNGDAEFAGNSGTKDVTVNGKPLTITANNASKDSGTLLTFAGTEFTTSVMVNSESVASVTLSSTGAAISTIAGSYDILPSAAVAGSGTDLSNYTIGYVNGTLTVNNTVPTVTSIVRTSATPTNLSSVGFTVTFSKPVTGVNIADFKLTNTILTGASVTGVTGTGPYTVTVNTGTGNGTIRLDIRATATIQDLVGNVFVGPYAGGETYTVNKDTAPTVPVLKSPANGAIVTGFTPTLDWNDSSEVMALAVPGWHYEINVTSPFGYNQTFNTVDNADPLVGLGASQYTFTSPLPASTTFTWKVRAYNDENQYSAWSAARTFTTKAATTTTKLNPPVLNLPANSALPALDNKRPTFSWGDVSGATSYTLQILKENPTTHLFTVVANTGTIKAPLHTYTPTVDLLPGTVYNWKVKANGPISSDFSTPFVFTTSSNPPKAAVLTAPLNAALVDGAVAQTLKWNPVLAVTTINPVTTYPAAASFEVEYATNSTFTGSTVASVNGNTLAQTQLLLSIGTLSPNRTYYWHVRSWSAAGATGNHSAWSAVRTFKTRLATPELNLPANSALLDNKRPTFSWDEVPGATSYTLQILKKNPTTNLFTVVANTGTIKVPAYVYTPTVDLLAGTQYQWKVKANGVNAGLYSAPFTFTTSGNPPKVPVLFAPANGILVNSTAPQTLDWNPVLAVVTTNPATTYPAAASFEVEYAMNSSFTGPSDTLVIINDNTIAGTHSAPLSLLPGRTYSWRVRSWSGLSATGNHSAWSAVRTIRVKFVAPTLTLPAAGATVPVRPTFTWSSGLNGLWTSYTLQVANNTAFTVGLRSFTIKAPTTTYTIPATLPALTSGTKYWRVRINGLYIPITSATQSIIVP